MIGSAMLWRVISVLTVAAVGPAPVQVPSCKVGDLWVFDQTMERGTQAFDRSRIEFRIQRTDGETMLVGIKREGAPGGYEDHVVGTDWSIRRVLNGQEQPTARPFTFPMTVGQTWSVDYVDPTPRGEQTSVHVHRVYKVVDWEDVTVPAGTFHAIKIEASGIDDSTFSLPSAVVGGAVHSQSGNAVVTHSQHGGIRQVVLRHHALIYYDPSVRNYVKSVEESYNTDDVVVRRQTSALVSFKPGG